MIYGLIVSSIIDQIIELITHQNKKKKNRINTIPKLKQCIQE